MWLYCVTWLVLPKLPVHTLPSVCSEEEQQLRGPVLLKHTVKRLLTTSCASGSVWLAEAKFVHEVLPTVGSSLPKAILLSLTLKINFCIEKNLCVSSKGSCTGV